MTKYTPPPDDSCHPLLALLARDAPVEAQPAASWLGRHSDYYHPGDRATCVHCQLMIHYFGPMPSHEELRAAELEERRRSRGPREKVPIPEALRWAVWERDNFTCAVCGTRRSLSIDHLIPASRGGPTTLDNLRTLCRRCNSRKGAR